MDESSSPPPGLREQGQAFYDRPTGDLEFWVGMVERAGRDRSLELVLYYLSGAEHLGLDPQQILDEAAEDEPDNPIWAEASARLVGDQ